MFDNELLDRLTKPGVSYLAVTHLDHCPVILSQDASECICGDNLSFEVHNDVKYFKHSLDTSRKARRQAQREAARAIKKAKKSAQRGTK